ncbi:MAG TPA: AbrB/MazE/SpoVT family DNA-binding domain-containing protein [Candidatus Nanoarchaeia archaeon]|nr:AbrB/MazE/SpoVT family DNA-binding domain-containing protein [Candidatus Nanoarchaeia archaeon]
MNIEVKTRKWGNSLGLVIPSEAVERLNIKPEETVVIEISKKGNVLKELFGSIKFKKTTKQLMDESKIEMESKWLR